MNLISKESTLQYLIMGPAKFNSPLSHSQGELDARTATDVAVRFIKQYRLAALPKGATKANGKWVVKVDVGVLDTRIATVEIDAKTSQILEYNIP
jgi:hypothetical protein